LALAALALVVFGAYDSYPLFSTKPGVSQSVRESIADQSERLLHDTSPLLQRTCVRLIFNLSVHLTAHSGRQSIPHPLVEGRSISTVTAFAPCFDVPFLSLLHSLSLPPPHLPSCRLSLQASPNRTVQGNGPSWDTINNSLVTLKMDGIDTNQRLGSLHEQLS